MPRLQTTPPKVSKLRAARLAKGLSLEVCAVKAGICRQTLANAERAPTLCTERTLRAVSKVLGVPAEELRP